MKHLIKKYSVNLDKKHILLIGGCGSGKTWVMKQIIQIEQLKVKGKFNLVRFLIKDELCLLGKYIGETFDGSDKLSMAVSKDFKGFSNLANQKNWIIICEGDRFTNKNFIELFKPLIIKIDDKGVEGRLKRGSNQSLRHLKRIETRVNNITPDIRVKNSSEALETIIDLL